MSTIPAVQYIWWTHVPIGPSPAVFIDFPVFTDLVLSEAVPDGVLNVGDDINVMFNDSPQTDTFAAWFKSGENFILVTYNSELDSHIAYSNSASWPMHAYLAMNTTPLVLTPLPCFLAGTRVSTERGEVAVEDLAPGDRLLTLSGDFAPLRWIGHRAVTERRIAADVEKALPIRFAAGSLGGGLPARDLWLSPDHCLHHDGVLVQAKELLNGTTVTQGHPGRPVVYYHLLMDRHEVIFAEGAESETYRPCGNVMAFANAGDFPADIALNQPRSSSRYPVKKSGARFEALKTRIAMGAEAAGASAAASIAA